MTLSPRLKIALGALALIGVTFLLGWFLYAIFFNQAPPAIEEVPGTSESGTSTSAGLSLSEEAEIRTPTDDTEIESLPSSVAQGDVTFTQRLTSTAITSPTLTNGNAIAYYNPNDGRFYMIDDAGSIIALSNVQFPKAESVVFADSADIVALEFADGSNILYDLEQEKQITLPSHWEDFEFSSEGDSVLSKVITSSDTNNALVVTSADGSQTNVIAALGANADKVNVNWSPNNTIVGFSETGSTQSGFGRRQIYLIGLDGQDAGAIIVEGVNFSAVWSPSGNDILYSVALATNDDRPSLWYTNATGDVGAERTKLDVETWVEKCTFYGEKTIICAVPQEITDGSGIDPRLIKSPDNIYEVNLLNGKIKLLATPVLDLQIFNLRISDDGTVLYFTDQYDYLNYIKLK